MPEALTLELLDRRQRHLTTAHDALRLGWQNALDEARREAQRELQDRVASAIEDLDARVNGLVTSQTLKRDLKALFADINQRAAKFLTVETWEQAYPTLVRVLAEHVDQRITARLQPWGAVRKHLEARVKVLENAALTMPGPCGDAARQQKEQLLRVSRVTWTGAMGHESFQ